MIENLNVTTGGYSWQKVRGYLVPVQTTFPIRNISLTVYPGDPGNISASLRSRRCNVRIWKNTSSGTPLAEANLRLGQANTYSYTLTFEDSNTYYFLDCFPCEAQGAWRHRHRWAGHRPSSC